MKTLAPINTSLANIQTNPKITILAVGYPTILVDNVDEL
jgi:hypothetical protein